MEKPSTPTAWAVRQAAAVGLLLGLAPAARASDVVEVSALTDRILLVHFDDGYVQHHQLGQPRDAETVLASALNVAQASTPGAYALSSPDDPAYATAQAPTQVNRKTKGTDFAWMCQAWAGNTVGCVNTAPDRAHEHWLYLTLPAALQPGRHYSLSTGALAANGQTWPLTFDVARLRSEAVHVNNVGYAPAAPLKYAYVYHWLGDGGGLNLAPYAGRTFRLLDAASRQPVFSGTLAFRKAAANAEFAYPNQSANGNLLGAEVYECDFSGFRTPGEYVVSVDGIGCSFPFRVAADAHWEPFYWTMKGIYQQRSGIALTAPYTNLPRPAPHNPNLTPGFAGKLKYTTTRHYDVSSDDADPADRLAWEAGLRGDLNTWGWYQDAGDWDAYPTHARVPAYLLFLYETNPTKFADNQLDIPESGNGLPDLLDEASWLIRFYKRTKDAIQAAGYGTGGVGGARVMGDLWGSDTRADGTTKGSWQDTDRQWVVSGEDPWTTYKYAGLAAHLAYLLRRQNLTDPQGVNWEQEATAAYAWAAAHVRPGDETPKFSYNLRRDRLYAAAGLYRLTGQAAYHQQVQADVAAAGWGAGTMLDEDWPFSAWVYLNLPANRPADPVTRAAAAAAQQNTADFLILSRTDLRACRWAGNFWQPMNTGQSTTPQTQAGAMGYSLLQTADPARAADYLKYVYTTADYFLGTNPLNTTWITGVGERHPNQIFHLDSWYTAGPTAAPRKGVVPYGPWQRDVNLGPPGPWNNSWPFSTLTPAIADWPGHEQWFDQRSSPLSAEFTIWQTNALAAFNYGFLWALNAPAVGPNPLPVTLTAFRAERQEADAVLNWATAGEEHSRGFGVEVSSDGLAYRPLGFVPSQGGGAAPRAYRFVDGEQAKTGARYYRLRQADEDGKTTYFGPRAVQFDGAPTALAAYPSVFAQNLTVELTLPAAASVRLRLLDALGRPVWQTTQMGAAGLNRWMAVPAHLGPGLYLLVAEAPGAPRLSQRVVKE